MDDDAEAADTFLEAAAQARDWTLEATDKCRWCGEPIVWLTSASTGRAIPFDPAPIAGGQWRVFARGGVLVAEYKLALPFGHVTHYPARPYTDDDCRRDR